MVGIKRRAYVGTKNDLPGIVREDFKRHDMANVFGNTHPPATFFPGGGGIIGVIKLIIDRFVPPKIKEGTDVISGAMQGLDRHGAIVGGGDIVEKETNVGETQEPKESWGSGAIQNRVGEPFEGLVPALTGVLVLLPRFTLPIQDAEVTQDILNLLTDFNLRTVTDELVGGTTASDIVFKGINKLALRLHTLDVSDKGGGADKDLSAGLPAIDSGCVRENSVGGDGLVTTVDIESRIRRLVTLLQNSAHGHTGVLGGDSESAFNDVNRKPTKEGTKLIKIRRLCLDNTCRRGRGRMMGLEAKHVCVVDDAIQDIIEIVQRGLGECIKERG
jgi:hypothetical protein